MADRPGSTTTETLLKLHTSTEKNRFRLLNTTGIKVDFFAPLENRFPTPLRCMRKSLHWKTNFSVQSDCYTYRKKSAFFLFTDQGSPFLQEYGAEDRM
ncbi:hypothetical protein SAMN05444955_11638 [Lihuaxuella thermophila]|uniref:Uncharacterized protein n=1 Tax=Lihuaxuella thermophila TaxID=1173111 RepID=A0A1H8I4T3_9BACL|nr:hypothetical protein SAMN05444955_11638 [Lihuaxuella thermophila]